MANMRPKMSITLPRNFTYHSPDSGEPKTPQEDYSDPRIPPPPRHSTYRVQRPNLDIFMQDFPQNFHQESDKSEDIPLPSIEIHQSPFQFPRPTLGLFASEPLSDGMLPPLSNRTRSYPTTPPAQLHASEIQPSSQWRPQTPTREMSVERPGSACSGISDSSTSSQESFVSYPSFGGSCTSPESDITDPFIPSNRVKRSFLSSPSRTPRFIDTPTRARPKQAWTSEMDNHLWNTYQIYLQDPTITPFKMVPGSIPPLGVSHRVAREAKKTWSKKRRSSQAPEPQLRDVHDESNAVPNDLVTPVKSGSATPLAVPEVHGGVWPRSESATRRRLKELCRRKFSITPTYRRLLQSRSPSPFVDPFMRRGSRQPSRGVSSSSLGSFSGVTRDLGVALVSSTATGPLAQLTASDTPSQNDEWFNQPVEVSDPQPSSSWKVGLGIDIEDTKPTPQLGSPFHYNTWGPTRSHQTVRAKPPVNHDTMHVTGTRLQSPMFASTHKRRAQHQLEDELSPGGSGIQNHLQDVFGPGSGDISQRRVRVRNRGVTLGAVSGREKLNRLFNPPTPGKPDSSHLTQRSNGLFDDEPSSVDGPKRLGSPFELDGKKLLKRSGFSRHMPSLSDPFVGESFSVSNPPSIAQTLDEFTTRNTEDRQPQFGVEAELSDAERIRRQILNLQRS